MKKGCGIAMVIAIIVLIIGGFFGYQYYKKYKANNVAKDGYFYVPTGANYQQILDSIKPFVKDYEAFSAVAKDRNLDKFHRPGKYRIVSGKSNTEIVDMVKNGNQVDISFRIGDFYSVYQMIGKVSKKTEIDSLKFANAFNEIAIKKGLKNAEDLKPYFFSDTYSFFWTVTPEEFFKKFEEQYDDFWNTERKEKEAASGFTRNQIYALASLVYKETGGKPDEMKTVAGLYINRAKKGMKLQSDPTVIFSVMQAENFKTPTIKRVLYKHLRQDSPYNTYMYAGIPPGPICIVNKDAVDAVLNAEKSDYIYMCADTKKFGYHRFTASDTEHAKNAKEYQDWLNSKNIK